METKIVTIDLGKRSYDIYVGAGLLFRLSDFVPVDIKGRRIFIVTDVNVKSYAEAVRNIVIEAGAQDCEMMVLPDGEKTKSFKRLEDVCEWMLDHNVHRNSIVMAVGGGVIGDLAGFAASVVMRGVSFVQIPTTLLAQVDSSVGGKTGINAPQGKNLIGAFYQPISVVADIDTLRTLPRRELLAGYAEVVKYGLINDIGFFEWLEDNGADVCNLAPEAVAYAIEKSVRAKAEIVQSDERESGRRALLNLGHTFGHALEAAAKYDGRLLHGEAVAIGMMMAFDLSVRLGHCRREDMERVEQHFKKVGLPTSVSVIEPSLKTSVDDLIAIMKKDKKSVGDKMTFILATEIGDAFIAHDVPEEAVREVLKDALGRPKTASEGFNTQGKGRGIKGLWKSAFSSHS
ncbi:MAG TPA: 3-dehydroquinate synthase [Rhodospirillaceae bacterium]|nr:3-dehydroquinate synthase [Rhodospirillaceae bacterium]